MGKTQLSATQFTLAKREENQPRRSEDHQLPMFMTAHELVGTYHPLQGDVMAGESTVYGNHEKFWNRKLEESLESGMSQSIRRKGVYAPVSVSAHEPGWDSMDGDYIQDGHHRAISAHYADPNMLVPVTHGPRPGDSSPDTLDTQGNKLPNWNWTGDRHG